MQRFSNRIRRITASPNPPYGPYFREPNGILFEIATDGPGFTTDEPLAHLGEKLVLPPFLEGRRQEIEAGLKKL